MMTTARLEETVADVTMSHRAIRAAWNEVVDALRPARDGEVKLDALVYVHGSGHWRPAIVERITIRQGTGIRFHVVHASPSRPDVMRRKRVKLEDLRRPVRPSGVAT